MPLFTLAFVQAHQYKDSVALMRVAQRLLALPEVVNATLQLGSPANKEILQEAGLLTDEVKDAGPGDIMVVVQARSAAAARAAVAAARAELAGGMQGGATGGSGEGQAIPATTLAMGRARMGAANLAQISVPGPYAAAEALKAVQLGLNVFLFSDNVAIADEVLLKQAAQRRGVLVMGPDCGTAIIGGVPLGFANQVRRGAIGIVAASGTGLQEVTTQIHRMGGGISHAIGTGGRDVSREVGAITMLQGIELLAADAATEVIAVVCKPPAPEVAARVEAALRAAGKPAVVLFIGAEARKGDSGDTGSTGDSAGRTATAGLSGTSSASGTSSTSGTVLQRVFTLVDCAAAAVALTRGRPGVRVRAGRLARSAASAASAASAPSATKAAGRASDANGAGLDAYPMPRRPRFAPAQRHLRALFSGGTFAAEAQALWARQGLVVHSNVPLDKRLALPDPKRASIGHTALDLGEDLFTVARPHPMIDQRARIERLLQEAADPSVRVILLDVVIGWGAHADPAGELKPALIEARRIAAQRGRPLALVGFVCGTELDPQGLARQEATLREAGMVLAGNSANAAWLAGQWARA